MDDETQKRDEEFTLESDEIQGQEEINRENDGGFHTVPDPDLKEISNMQLSRFIDLSENDFDTESVRKPRGILSATDREFLFGLKDYSHAQSEANRRQDIRDRVKNSLNDFKLLWSMLDSDDREQIFSGMGEEEVNECIEAMVTFLYLGTEYDIARLETNIKRGILAGEQAVSEDRSVGDTRRVEVSIVVDYHPDPDTVYDKLEDIPLSELTIEEIGVLAKAGKLDPEDIKKMNDSDIYPPSGYFGNENPEPAADVDPYSEHTECDDHQQDGAD